MLIKYFSYFNFIFHMMANISSLPLPAFVFRLLSVKYTFDRLPYAIHCLVINLGHLGAGSEGYI